MEGQMILKQDIQRGVKHLKDKNYNPWANGITRFSLEFFKEIQKYVDIQKVYRAVLKYSMKHHYSLTLYTRDGFELVFNGVSFGYSGEGSRGTAKILKDCGFKNPERVFDLREHHKMTSDMIQFFKR